jgi:hypothetical protein
MFVRSLLITISAFNCAVAFPAPASSIVSIYTDLSPSRCKTIKVTRDPGSSVQKCAGVAGYSLLVLDDDARQSVNVVTPDGKEHGLDYWSVVTRYFSSLGEKAEWRMVKKGGKLVPIALIVRVYANENPEVPEQRTSYLAVAKITPEKICVTAKIKATTTANAEARRAADASAAKPCLE